MPNQMFASVHIAPLQIKKVNDASQFAPKLRSAQATSRLSSDEVETLVNLDFVVAAFGETSRFRLHRPLQFGTDLTDDTYLEFILDKAKILFLILCDLGIPERILEVIDSAYEDVDLPISLNDIPTLMLDNKPNERLKRKFHDRQYAYIVRELGPEQHIDYESRETVPVTQLTSLARDGALHSWTRVKLFNKRSGQTFVRRRLALVARTDHRDTVSDLLADLEVMRGIQHDHFAAVQYSYSYKGFGYILTPFVADYTLRYFFTTREPDTYWNMTKWDFRTLLCNWIHCLADALAYLHQHNICHFAIRPSNIVIDPDLRIAFSDVGSLQAFQHDKLIDPIECYNYFAPEMVPEWQCPKKNKARWSVLSNLKIRRKRDTLTAPGVSRLSTNIRQEKGLSRYASMVFRPRRQSGFSDDDTTNLLRLSYQSTTFTLPSIFADFGTQKTSKSDVFSLGCIFLDILSCLNERRPSELRDFLRNSAAKKPPTFPGSPTEDRSVHNNIDRAQVWMERLGAYAAVQSDKVFRAVPALLHLLDTMLSPEQHGRPNAASLRDEIASTLATYGGFDGAERSFHCEKHESSGPQAHNAVQTPELALQSPLSPITITSPFTSAWSTGPNSPTSHFCPPSPKSSSVPTNRSSAPSLVSITSPSSSEISTAPSSPTAPSFSSEKVADSIRYERVVLVR